MWMNGQPMARQICLAVRCVWLRCKAKEVQPELFIVGTLQGRVVATAMAGYDGHRGWVNYLAVEPACQRQGLGEAIMRRVEALLVERGCPKLNLQVRGSNEAALAFYARLGYRQDDVVSLGHRLIPD